MSAWYARLASARLSLKVGVRRVSAVQGAGSRCSALTISKDASFESCGSGGGGGAEGRSSRARGAGPGAAPC